MSVRVSYERKRGCGFRKKGGLYLMAEKPSAPCGGLPFKIAPCSCCGVGVRPSRGYTWIEPDKLFADVVERIAKIDMGWGCGHVHCQFCPVSHPPTRAGLDWVGVQHYPTVEHWMREARDVGISRRITAVPKDFEVGKTWVFLGHRAAIHEECPKRLGPGHPPLGSIAEPHPLPAEATPCDECKGTGELKLPGIFTVYRPTRIEKIVDEEVSAEEVAALEKRGIEPVIVRKVEQSPELPLSDEEGGEPVLH
jgi:hypothetical protein